MTYSVYRHVYQIFFLVPSLNILFNNQYRRLKGGRGGLIDSETEEVLAEFDFLSTHTSNEHESTTGRKDPSWRPG